jgi:hypothetical protein
MKGGREKEIQMFINFFRRIPAFDGWTRPALYNICSFVRYASYPPGTIIQGEEDPQEDLCFIKRGTVLLYKKAVLPNAEVKDVLVKRLGQYEYFGEHAMDVHREVTEEDREKKRKLGMFIENKKCFLTAVADKECKEPIILCKMALLDAQTKCRTLITKSPIYEQNNEDFVAIYRQSVQRAKWEAAKTRHFDSWLKEKHRDPNSNVHKNKMMDSTKHVWKY